MKKTILTLSTWFVAILVIFNIDLPVNAASITTQSLQVFHPEINNTITMGKETFSYKILTNNDASDMSVTEITQPSQYNGFLFEKHILQTPEEVYIAEGDFEFVFSQSNKKTQTSKGDIVVIPTGMPFGFRHTGKGKGKVVVVSRSTALPDMLAEIGDWDSKNSQPDIEAISAIAQKYGIEFLN